MHQLHHGCRLAAGLMAAIGSIDRFTSPQSLRLRESNATLHSAKFNIDRDIPGGATVVTGNAEDLRRTGVPVENPF